MSDQNVSAVERALIILDAFTDQDADLSLKDLSERTGMYKSTITRLAGTLESRGFLAISGRGRYRLGPALWRLGSIYRRSFRMDDVVRPHLAALVTASGETASFYVPEGENRLCLFRENSPKSLRHHLEEGAILPCDRGAAGHVIRAWGNGVDDLAIEVLNTGFAQSDGERDPDISAIAVPVLDRQSRLLGALNLSGPRSRFGLEHRNVALVFLRQHAIDCGRALSA
ncbi:IclR family transcriptional regulator [Thalassospira alkalitolerans]|uniref:IclR family transcriptional regulator n=1 Tax=Thalassospira alkalitolerans TaxID=1293890 RepID=A0A1Y2LHN3_9PROT|nr:IclR family transcriptional regulator [Thalassospira alkalitolerans]OSQ50063.1 IclR family transcriptional regulator [Thalassospira alkalitolerans]|tara:strand:+ start:177034 stop:177714 length:681 start_codon:yes stop_codon:yes gene_type:complete